MSTDEPLLRPPGHREALVSASGSRRYWIWLALTAMLALALFIVFYLPQWTGFRETAGVPAANKPRTPHVQPNKNADTRHPGVRAEAEDMLKEYLQTYARLELDAAPIWGEPQWSQAIAGGQQGDRWLSQLAYVEARDAYAGSLDLLLDIQVSRPQRLLAALEAGKKALARGEAALAIKQFELALAINPQNQVATVGAARAGVRDQVLDLMQSARDAESQGEMETARQAYAQASRLDGEYLLAAEALRRVTAVIADESFRALLGQAIRALDAGRFDASGKALAQAARLKPDDSSLRDIRQRLEAARKNTALANFRSKAHALAAAEDWQAAVTWYEKSLALAPGAAFAEQGARRARERVDLHQQVDYYLSDPTRLYSDTPLANAQRLLASAGTPPIDEPRLSDKLARLRRHVVEAGTPIPVNLRSDGETEVVIYHVGRRGRFLQQRLELTPGTYTAVGSRSGYRDVRKVFDVKPGVAVQTVVIQCREEI